MKNDEPQPDVILIKKAAVASPASQRLLVELDNTTLYSCSVAIVYYDGDTVTVNYKGLPGNQPQTYKNFVAIWEASMIPWTVPPLAMAEIGQNNEQGSMTISGVTITRSAYIVGYSVGPDISNICCSSVISIGGLLAAPTQTSISLNYIGINSLSIHYQTLGGYQPMKYNNWIGLWKGFASPYSAGAPLATVDIDSNANEGSIGINNVPLGINTNYTLIYFMGKENPMAAAILNFSTSTTTS
ncbi:hypothetical protein [Chitinophaga sancti]|uniref:Uncharacterized protein n=1 Tax=Chitinophaga sancti TaxID=1004 RepID=A0A1K1RXC0_9BACT|nr:hypothetical protein [Chitinophaga sancti]WQD64011.1 hypothetical protein U0033_06355 [Chitinophaga sancti]WQG90365.1 hypothetical protein SR876_02565 [Chitinophaga sancti]SFW76484.1 hypothetical protein SAMN05661012_04364 [Chitinophaga sancti]